MFPFYGPMAYIKAFRKTKMQSSTVVQNHLNKNHLILPQKDHVVRKSLSLPLVLQMKFQSPKFSENRNYTLRP